MMVALGSAKGGGVYIFYTLGDSRTQNFFDFSDARATPPVKYTILEDRIFRNGEIRYYDHPKSGVLARITRVEEEEPEEPPMTDELFLLPAN